eukprot:371541-Amphidinium_carterae.1
MQKLMMDHKAEQIFIQTRNREKKRKQNQGEKTSNDEELPPAPVLSKDYEPFDEEEQKVKQQFKETFSLADVDSLVNVVGVVVLSLMLVALFQLEP